MTKIKKMKHSTKREQSGEDLEGKMLEKQEENQCLNNRNQELQNKIKELEVEKSRKRKESKRFRIMNNLLENKEAQTRKMHPKIKSRK